jgi:hypothetical protein
MTWGSNASYDYQNCPYCGSLHRDDTDVLESTHMQKCTWRTPWRAFKWRFFRIRHWKLLYDTTR